MLVTCLLMRVVVMRTIGLLLEFGRGASEQKSSYAMRQLGSRMSAPWCHVNDVACLAANCWPYILKRSHVSSSIVTREPIGNSWMSSCIWIQDVLKDSMTDA